MATAAPSQLGKISPPRLILIPWDYDSAAHFQRVVDQRHVCGWGANDVENWKAPQATGEYNLQWIVSPIFRSRFKPRISPISPFKLTTAGA